MNIEYIGENCVHLSAEDGMYLTQSNDVPIVLCQLCHNVWTSVSHKDNWRDCTQEEAAEVRQQ